MIKGTVSRILLLEAGLEEHPIEQGATYTIEHEDLVTGEVLRWINVAPTIGEKTWRTELDVKDAIIVRPPEKSSINIRKE